MPDYSLEEALREHGFLSVCGVDEAGRGPLSGPVVAAACILPLGCVIEGLNDSKKLSAKKRDALFDEIKEKAIAYAIASASPAEIDEINILNATMLAMRRAIEGLPVPADFALVDGNVVRDFPIEAKPIVKGDAISCSISAASILAKVTRDRLCLEDDLKYPEYQFAKHKGYSTALHMQILREKGPCPIHRRSFLKFLNEDQ
ncbi:MAG: ribonuclease HII [Clostridia bacterium]|jgi:ribonuclease HII|nr:ribonuclease HII [Clostridia bacterium]MBO7170906.1 ribonuclease HII [Clostridia bacterium]